MKEKIEDFLKNLSSCFQLAQMYGVDHPEFNKILQNTYQKLQVILYNQNKLTIAVVEGELTSGDYIFFNLSKKIKILINKLLNKGFERIKFEEGVKDLDLKKFISVLLISEEKSSNTKDNFSAYDINNIHLDNIKESEVNQEDQPPRDSDKMPYVEAIGNLSSSMTNIFQGKSVELDKVGFIVDSFMGGVNYYYQELLKLSKIKGKDVTTFAHLLNVSFLAISFSKYLGFSDAECKKIGLASLFHDIGKIYISNKLLKGGKLNDKEFEQIKSHSLLGAEILLKFVDKLGRLAPVVALEHHLKLNLGGYPKLRFPRRLHVISMLVSLCDVYDALSQRRSYKNNFPPERIYKIMAEGKGSQFHPELFDNFFEFMGVWPKGTIVLLSNDKIARVEQQNHQKIFSPKVKIVSDSLGKIIDLSSNQSNLKIEKSLNPYKEGAKYLKS
ncbi:HD domain-containing protein [Candidatus Babeliales bacterium]|nr:HD domain-containing protein [Candidatus Babeliales bacterium]